MLFSAELTLRALFCDAQGDTSFDRSQFDIDLDDMVFDHFFGKAKRQQNDKK